MMHFYSTFIIKCLNISQIFHFALCCCRVWNRKWGSKVPTFFSPVSSAHFGTGTNKDLGLVTQGHLKTYISDVPETSAYCTYLNAWILICFSPAIFEWESKREVGE